MRRESALGRTLWIALVVVLAAYVVADFVRSPFLAPRGAAAVRPTELTLWTPASEAGGESGSVLTDTAAALELAGHTVALKSLVGGSSKAVGDFLSHPPRDGANLLVVTNSTLADLAQDRRDRLIPGAAEEAVLASDLLRHATPIGLLESDPLAIAVGPRSRIESSGQLLSSMRAAPWRRLFGIEDDTWSQAELAALVNRAGVDGHVRFSVFQSGAGAGQAIDAGAADVALATRGSLREDVRSGRLRELRWPFGEGRAPRSWVALFAPAGFPRPQAAKLRRWVADLRRDRVWLAQLRRAGRSPGDPGTHKLASFLGEALNAADRLQRLAQRVGQR